MKTFTFIIRLGAKVVRLRLQARSLRGALTMLAGFGISGRLA